MVVLINPFVVFTGRDEAFFELWTRTNAIFRATPGYLNARLVRAVAHQASGQRAPFTHVNIAEWTSRDAYAAALANPSLRPFGALYREVCTFDPALYETLIDDRR